MLNTMIAAGEPEQEPTWEEMLAEYRERQGIVMHELSTVFRAAGTLQGRS